MNNPMIPFILDTLINFLHLNIWLLSVFLHARNDTWFMKGKKNSLLSNKIEVRTTPLWQQWKTKFAIPLENHILESRTRQPLNKNNGAFTKWGQSRDKKWGHSLHKMDTMNSNFRKSSCDIVTCKYPIIQVNWVYLVCPILKRMPSLFLLFHPLDFRHTIYFIVDLK